MRPRFHFTAESGWINDPHGVTFRDGGFHLFYQHVPHSLTWAPNCHWGHATSPDLFTFEQVPIAIAPGDGDDGIWTGSLVTDSAGNPTIFYTSVTVPDFGIGRVRTAVPVDDSWVEWTKGPAVAEAPVDLDLIAYRDPFVFQDHGRWRMFVGAALADGTAAALSYSSPDLTSWRYDGIAAQRSTLETDPVWSGALWECPQLFELDGRHVMVTSVWDADVLHYVVYAIGDYHDGVFTPQTWGRLSYGDSYYAPTVFTGRSGRSSLLFWLRDISDPDAGWAGAHSVPHELRLDGDVLIASPASGLDAYRRPATPERTKGLAVDAVWASGSRANLVSAGSVVATIEVRDESVQLSVDERAWQMPYAGGPLRIIADGPILEVSSRAGVVAAPIRPSGDSLTVTADGALEVYDLEHLTSARPDVNPRAAAHPPT
jgi:beta-fructofuranosidase